MSIFTNMRFKNEMNQVMKIVKTIFTIGIVATFLDILTTWIFVNKYGVEYEANIFFRKLMHVIGVENALLINAVISILTLTILYMYFHKARNIKIKMFIEGLIYGFSIPRILPVINNFLFLTIGISFYNIALPLTVIITLPFAIYITSKYWKKHTN